MRMTPPEALFSHVYYAVGNVVFVVLYLLALRMVKNTRWQAHARWIKPFLVSSVLSVIGRTIYNTHYMLGIGLPDRLWRAERACYYIGFLFDLSGAVILIKTLRRMVNGTLPEASPETPPAPFDHGTWPPPPTAPR